MKLNFEINFWNRVLRLSFEIESKWSNQIILENGTISPRGDLPIADCNVDCECSNIYQPICYNDISYTNPCLAGCHTATNGSFYDCSCLSNSTNQMSNSEIKLGACEKDCIKMLAPFLIMVFIIKMQIKREIASLHEETSQ